jgi:flagellar biosynthetic protein FliO
VPGGLFALALQHGADLDARGGGSPTGGYLVSILQNATLLIAIGLIGWLVARVVLARGSAARPAGRHIRIVERMALEPRRSVYLLEVGKRILLVGASEQSMTLLAEFAPEQLPALGKDNGEHSGPRSFKDLFDRLRGRPAPAASTEVETDAPAASPPADRSA